MQSNHLLGILSIDLLPIYLIPHSLDKLFLINTASLIMLTSELPEILMSTVQILCSASRLSLRCDNKRLFSRVFRFNPEYFYK